MAGMAGMAGLAAVSQASLVIGMCDATAVLSTPLSSASVRGDAVAAVGDGHNFAIIAQSAATNNGEEETALL